MGTISVQSDSMERLKGMSFTIIAILFFYLVLLTFFFQKTSRTFIFEQLATKNKVEAIKDFFDSIIHDSKQALDISAKRAISASISYVITNGIPLSDSKKSLEELMLNGTLNGAQESLMEGSTLNDWKSKIEFVSRENGFFINISINSLEIKPYDSFNLMAILNLTISLTDRQNTALINRNVSVERTINIESFEDPLYPLNTLGRVTSVIQRSPHLKSHLDLNQLNEDLNNSYYHPSLNGASFLDRLEGKYFVQSKYRDLNNNYIGLESFVDKDKLASAGFTTYAERSNIDYIYFSGTSVTTYRINGMPNNFRLDNETTIDNLTHLQFYNVEDKII